MTTLRPTRRKLVVRIVLVLATLFAAWHTFAQFLWIAPASQLRTVIPGDLLEDYQIPLFGQSWSVFAPDPINGDYTFKVRAILGSTNSEGSTYTTDYIDASAAELTMLTHNPFPPRASALAAESASRYKNAWDALNDGQKEVVSLGYFKGTDWNDRFIKDIYAAAGDDPSQISATSTFVNEERIANAYATQAAKAVWGDRVELVQFEIYRQNIVPFYDRDNPKAVRPDKMQAPTGWRGLIVNKGQSSDEFAEIFAPLVKGK